MKGGDSTMSRNILLTILLALIVGIGPFYAGTQYQKSQASANNEQFAQSGRGQSGRFGGNRGRFGMATVGNVVSQDANSITVQLPDGSSKIITISNSTTFVKTNNTAKSDVQNGMRIAVFGTTNSDGSVTAQNIQINPQMGMRRIQPTQAQ